MSKKQISLITAILLVISSTVIGFGQKRDIHNHWAEELINYMVEKNVVNGYPDGTFKPENKMTKAEFYSVINGLIGYDEKTAISFNDVKESNWFYEHVQKGVSANYIPKTSNLNPNANITREEVARILSIVFEVEENHEEFKKFTDYNSINMELRGVVGGLAKNGYLAGYPDGTIRPQGEIKRSEVVAMLSNITGEIINSPGTNSIRDIKRNVLINTENSVLKDSIIEGNLYITEGVKDGDITLDNVEVKGNLVVKGGGENSVIIKNSKINRILVKKPRGIVRLVLESTNVNTMNASKEAKIELLNNTSVKDINIEDKIELFLEKGSIISILNIKGNESILEVLGNIEKINGEQEIAINGERIKLSEINEIKEGNVVDNKATETLTQGGSPSSGGSGGSLPPSEVIINSITIKGINNAGVIAKDTSVQLYADILPLNATNKALRWSVDNSSVLHISDNGYIYAAGKGIATVTATARDGSGVTGSLTITVTEGQEDSPRVNIGQTITKNGVSVTIEKLEYHEDGFRPDDFSGSYKKGFSVYYRIENNSGTTHHIPSTRFKLDPASYNAEVNHLGYGIVDRDGNTSSFIYPGETREFTKIYQFNQDIDIYEIDVMFQYNSFGVWFLSSSEENISVTDISIKGINDGAVIEKDTTLQLYADILPLNATNKGVRWSVDNSAVLHISDNGYIYALGEGIATVTATARDGSGVTGRLTITVTEGEEDSPRVNIGQTITKNGVSVTIEKLEYHEDGFRPDDFSGSYKKGFSVYYRIENNSGTTHRIPSTKFKLDPAIYNAEVNSSGYGMVFKDGNTSSFIYPGETREFTKIYVFSQDIDIYEIDVMFQQNSFGVWALSSSEENIPVTDISIKGINDGAVIEKDTTLQLYADILPLNATNKGVRWSVDNSLVLHISDNGYIYALGEGIATVTATARDGSGVTGSLTITVTEEEDTPRVDIGQTITKGGVSVTIEKLEYHEDGFIPDGSGNIYNKGFSVYYRIENNSGTTHHIPSTRFKLDPASYNAEVNHLGYGIVDRDGNTSSFIYPGETREFIKIYQFNQDIDIYEIDVMFQHNLFGVWGL